MLSSVTNFLSIPGIYDTEITSDILRDALIPAAENIEILDVIQNLQHISSRMDTVKPTISNRRSIADAIYSTEYRLFQMQRNQIDHPNLMVNEINLAEPLRLGAHLFLHLAIRELPASSSMHQNMSERLKSTLSDGECLELQGASNSAVSLLLWVFFMGYTASSNQVTKSYFVKYLIRVTKALGLYSLEKFEDNLRKTLWRERFCNLSSSKAWEEMAKIR
jgi:hypothetical protein